MKTKLKVLMIALLSSTLIYSQSTYPKQTIINKDTLILITPNQLKQANRNFVELDAFKSKDSIKTEIIFNNQEIINNQKLEITNLKFESELHLNNFNLVYDENKKLSNKYDKERKKSKLKDKIIVGVGIISFILGVCL